MRELFDFIYKYRALLVFAALEFVCLLMIVNKNRYQHLAFLSSSNQLTGYVDALRHQATSFFQLNDRNKELLVENTALKKQLEQLRGLRAIPVLPDSGIQFSYISAEIVNKSIFRTNNYITINKGAKHGIKPGMAVISPVGIIGIIKTCSVNFSVLYTVLHQNISISSRLKRTNTICSVKWKNSNYHTAHVFYVPQDIALNFGDSVVTSGYNSVFPPDILIGIVNKAEIKPSEMFQDITIELSTNFANLSYVHVVSSRVQKEKTSIEAAAH